MSQLDALKIKIFADGADLDGMLAMYADPRIAGFTTNPTLMRKAGITDYEAFAKSVLERIPDRPISFEVFADNFDDMDRQARLIAGWGRNVNVKIPITNTLGQSSADLIARLSGDGIMVNVTAIMTVDQVRTVAAALHPESQSIVSVFAGRIADTGRDPIPLMRACLDCLAGQPGAALLWASPRELLNLFQADEMGCQIITMTNDLLAKMAAVGKDLDTFSLETVKMFRTDAQAADYTLKSSETAGKTSGAAGPD
ncbi:MAG: transaldolase [Proteobacteria bacterium]|nr:transaldolase [Pseudomonadota bacterium]